MIWRSLCPVPVFLSVILTLGCNSSAKHVQMEEITKDAELMATLHAPPAHSLGLKRPIISLQHPQFAIPPEANIDFQIPIVTPNPNMSLKILAVTPNPNTDYKIAAATPAPGADYKMLIVPNQGQLPHAIGELEFPLRPKLDMPPVPWKPEN